MVAASSLLCAALLTGGCGYRRAVAAENHLRMGVLALREGDQASADRHFESARRASASAQVLSRIGLAYVAVRRCADGVPLLVESLAQVPRQADVVRRSLFECYQQMGEPEKAERVLQDALRVHHDDAWALNNLGYTAVDEGVHLQTAFRLVQRAVELAPRNGMIVDSLGWAYYRLGDLAKARQTLERAARLSSDPEILYHLGVVCADTGDVEEAVRHLRKALQIDPGHRAARDALLRLGR